MLSFLKAQLLGVVTIVLMALDLILAMIPIYILSLLKFIIRLPAWQRVCARMLMRIATTWMWGIIFILKLTQNISWDVEGIDDLSLDEWYFVNSNHQSWTDIIIMIKIFTGRIPFLKFFLKQELFWVPMLGTAWWALDYPFMKRYSKAFLEKHPELRGKDLEVTRKACERYKHSPVSVLNFIEGTRFTPEKHRKQESPYRHLLRPKAGGFAFAISAMTGKITNMLDVTVVYPDGPVNFWELLCGRLSRVVVRVRQLVIPEEFLYGNYQDDPDFRERFQAWVSKLWDEKDELIESLSREYKIAN
ncbi:MAG: acyltransferase [Deltaproteobacteria bacterium]|nr:acyltransferase [Deltaproteobacteria bacterium]MBW2595354.1 acyltransferase [Deltaproteobacteria bacterium]MBW2650560.1 acyltransferase [Deltaproteobacteria bacterium]